MNRPKLYFSCAVHLSRNTLFPLQTPGKIYVEEWKNNNQESQICEPRQAENIENEEGRKICFQRKTYFY